MSAQGTPQAAGRRAGQWVGGRCPLCAGTRLRVLHFRYDFKGRHLYGVRCACCRLVFIDPQPAADELRDLYSEAYFTSCTETAGAHGRLAYQEIARAGATDRKRAARKLDRLLLQTLEGRGMLLEIGCGPGYLLSEFRDLGWTAQGLEISSYAVQFAREHLGIEVVCGGVTPECFPHGSADVILMGDVLEHLAEPLESLRIARTWLRPGGVLVVAVPSTLNLLSGRLGLAAYRLLGRVKTLRIPPYHLFEYTPATLVRMVTAAGFSVVRLRQSAVPLRRMGLRGSALENSGKVVLQGWALMTSRVLNCGGDRLLLVARHRP